MLSRWSVKCLDHQTKRRDDSPCLVLFTKSTPLTNVIQLQRLVHSGGSEVDSGGGGVST